MHAEQTELPESPIVPSSQPEPPVLVLAPVEVEVGPVVGPTVVDVLTPTVDASPPAPLEPVAVFVFTEQAAADMPTNAKPTSNFEVFMIFASRASRPCATIPTRNRTNLEREERSSPRCPVGWTLERKSSVEGRPGVGRAERECLLAAPRGDERGRNYTA